MAELRPYNPSFRAKTQGLLANLFTKMGVSNDLRQGYRMAEGITGNPANKGWLNQIGLMDFTGLGGVATINEAIRDTGRAQTYKDYILPGVNIGLGVLEMLPFVGKPASIAAKTMLPTKVPARAKGPPLEVNPAMKLKDVPVIDPMDLEGMTIKPTVADLTNVGTYYRGIDSSKLDRPTPMTGGYNFPLQKKQMEKNVIWGDILKTAQKKFKVKADLIGVAGMKADSHTSNEHFNEALTETMMAYVRDGRLKPEDVQTLNKMVTDSHTQIKTGTKDGPKTYFKELESFPGFDSPNLDAWLKAHTGFETRKKIAGVVRSATAQKMGAPNVDAVANATVDKSVAGWNVGRPSARDTMLLLKPDYDRPIAKLGQDGLPDNKSFDHGLFGEVFGRFENPVSNKLLYPDYYNKQALKSNEHGIRRAFDLTNHVETLTRDKLIDIGRAMRGPNSFIDQAGQARVAVDMLSNNWKSSLTPKIKGGIAPIDFENALKITPERASLTSYKAKDIMKGAKDGSFEAFQLGDSQIYFGIDKKPDYSYFPNFKPKAGDKALVGGVSNEVGVSGMAAPSTVLKSIEEGVTVLDAFNVKSAKHPDGFLPEYYADFGFEVEDTIPFNKEVYLEEHTINDYNDLIDAWKNNGWSPELGMPDVVVMRYKGNENGRSNATKRFFTEDKSFLGSGEVGNLVANARGSSQSSLSKNVKSEKGIGNNPGRNPGGLRENNKPGLSGKSRGIVNELLSLTKPQADNLGIDWGQLQKLKGPTSTTPAQKKAQGVLDLLSSGKSDQVTDEMLEKADPAYLFDNYDLPMDAASLKARSKGLLDSYHGTSGNKRLVDLKGDNITTPIGDFYSTDNPSMAQTYGDIVYPLKISKTEPGLTVDAKGGNWNRIPNPYVDEFGVIDTITTPGLVSGLRKSDSGAQSLRIKNVTDRGALQNYSDGKGNKPSKVNVSLMNRGPYVRSRFARFDPRLKHLKNLSAGIIPIGLLPFISGGDNRQ